MKVLFGPSSPLLGARNQLELDHAFRAEVESYASVGSLCSHGHEYTQALTKRSKCFGAADNLREVRRTNLFLTLSNKHQVDRQFSPGALECVQRGEERPLRPFRVYGSAPDQNFSEPGLVYQSSVPWRRRPLRWIHLLHVVHEVNADGTRGARIER